MLALMAPTQLARMLHHESYSDDALSSSGRRTSISVPFIRLMMVSRRKVYDIFRGEETRSIFSCRGVEGWPEGSQAT